MLQLRYFSSFTRDLLIEWVALWREIHGAPVFLHPQYQHIWWETEGTGELQLVAAYEDNVLVAIAPLFRISAADAWRIVGAKDLSDYLDFLVKPELSDAFATAFTTFWQEHHAHENLLLECLRTNSYCLTALSQQLAKHSFACHATATEVCPAITLPETWEEYFAQLEPKTAKNFQRLLREIGEEDEISFRLIDSPVEMEDQIPHFITLHKKSGPDKQSFWSPERETFFTRMSRELAQEQLCQLLFLDVNGIPAAGLLFFRQQQELQIYNSGFDAYQFGYLGVGNAIILHSLKLALEQGIKSYDFLRGNESYKYLFGAVDQPLYELIITPVT